MNIWLILVDSLRVFWLFFGLMFDWKMNLWLLMFLKKVGMLSIEVKLGRVKVVLKVIVVVLIVLVCVLRFYVVLLFCWKVKCMLLLVF